MIVNLIRIVSALLGIVGFTLIVPLVTAVACKEFSVILSFAVPMLASWLLFFLTNIVLFRKKKVNLSIRATFLIVAAAWIFTSLFGAIPFVASGCIPSFTDAFFESVSGFSTTGATILSEIESLPRSINLWRCMTHWLGGMGIVALTVALLPLLGVGGFQLIKAETTGPEKSKITSKITTTAKVLWLIYMVLTLLQTVILMFCGMDFIDALSHSFATLGTGGFSTRNASVGSYGSVSIDIVCTVFMFLAGINFSLFYFAVTRKYTEIRENSELKAYTAVVFICIAVVTFFLLPVYGSFGTALRYSAFQVVSIITTTGFATADYTFWPPAAQFFILLLFFIGACSGSTGGGIKIIRWVVLFKQTGNEMKRMLHPHGVFSIRLNNRPARSDIIFNVTAFFTVYLILVFVTVFAGCAAHLEIFTSFSAALSMVGNVGPAFGQLGPAFNYGFLPSALKWWYCFAMIAGRLELYTLILFFIPSYWKK